MRIRIAVVLVLLTVTATAALADLRGKVTYPDDTPHVKAAATIRSSSGASATVYTGTDGIFLHPNIPAGEYTLEIRTPRDSRTLRITVTTAPITDVPPVKLN